MKSGGVEIAALLLEAQTESDSESKQHVVVLLPEGAETFFFGVEIIVIVRVKRVLMIDGGVQYKDLKTGRKNRRRWLFVRYLVLLLLLLLYF